MKKIDLHIHTIPTFRDSHFDFSLPALERYISESRIDAIAITNHDLFDIHQFNEIKESIKIPVFPGIEVYLEDGHVLVITEPSDLIDFNKKSEEVSKIIKTEQDKVTLSEFKAIFGNLSKYLLVPHYEKHPSIKGDTLKAIIPFVSAGEVDSAKKFLRAIKDQTKLTPVLFSDARISNDLVQLPTRQTYIDCGDITISSLKQCLKDKKKVALSEKDGNKLWQVFENGQHLSTGLNVLVGGRSTGKTYMLDAIYGSHDNVKYIKQFELVQQDEETYTKQFNSDIQRKRSSFVDQYLSGFKFVLDDIMNVDVNSNDRKISQYVDSLLRSAEDADKRDAFSKTSLFDEVDFPTNQTKTLIDLIESVRQVIENIEHRAIIEKHLNLINLRSLACELIELLWEKNLESKKRRVINDLVKEIKQKLKMKTSAVQIEDVDIYQTLLEMKKVERFCEIVAYLKQDAVISEENIQGFKIEAKKQVYSGALEIKESSGVKVGFRDAFKEYVNPYKYLRMLLELDGVPRSDLYKLFVKITYQILNKDGSLVSGGERSEFRLLQEIRDAQNYEMLLIDEPESSFDNIFLKSDVNQILKEISETMPVVIVTHNNTVGASGGADYLLYAEKSVENGQLVRRIYSGYPNDKNLFSVDGKSISNHDAQLNSLEAGFDAYTDRRQSYEAIKDK